MTDEFIKLLIVEDDKIDQMAYKRFIREYDLPYKVSFVDSVKSAKEVVLKTQFDLILMDYMLSDGTAFDLFNYIGDTPSVIVTGAGDTDIAVSAMKKGAYDYLVKDPEGEYLKTMPIIVNHALERKRQNDELEEYRERLEDLVRQRTEALEKEVQERKKAEQELSEKNTQYSTFVQNSVVGIYRLDFSEPIPVNLSPEEIAEKMVNTGYISECNEAFAEMYGAKFKEKFIGRKLKDILIDRDISIKRLADFVRNDFQTKLLDNSKYDMDGKIKYFRNFYSGYVSEGMLKWIWGIQTDITEKKEAENIQRVLYEIANEGLATDNIKDLFEKIRSKIDKILNASNLFIALLSTDRKDLRIVYATIDEYLDWNLSGKKTITEYLIKNNKPLLLNEKDIKKLYYERKINMVGTPAKSWLGVPLQIDDTVIGAIVLQSYTNPKQFNNKHLQFMNFISNQIAIAVERNRRDEQIRNSLKEKEVLLKEVHHRVKNNLQVISSLLSLQSQQVQDKNALQLFRETQDRVRSISLVHERLYATKDFSSIDFNEYVYNLGYELFRTYGIDPDRISLDIKIDNVILDVESAVPCGLVINELISNSLKYAFPNTSGKKKGRVTISMKEKNNGMMSLVVSDNGVGIPEDADILHSESLGLKLVSILVEDQLQGKIKIERKNGLTFRISFKRT